MSTESTTTTSSCKEKKQERKGCLAVVETLDGCISDGRSVRVRLPLFEKIDENKPTNDNDDALLGLKEHLAKALKLTTTDVPASRMEIELYDSSSQSFEPLNNIYKIPSTCCRLRITIEKPMEQQQQQQQQASSTFDNERLALPWREFSSSIDLDGKLLLKDGRHAIVIREVSNSGMGTGTNIWDGAIALAKFLEFHDQDPNSISYNKNKHGCPDPTYSVRGKRVLELGAGTGLVGIAAHVAFGAREVVLTDLEYSLGNLLQNLFANHCNLLVENKDDGCIDATDGDIPPTINARVLDWFDLKTCDDVLKQQGNSNKTSITSNSNTANSTTNLRQSSPQKSIWIPEVVLAADVVWVESLVRPLVQTLHHVCATKASQSPTAPPLLILLSYQRRSQAVEDLLFQTLHEFSFGTEDVTTTSATTTTTSGAESKIRIYRITYLPEVKRARED